MSFFSKAPAAIGQSAPDSRKRYGFDVAFRVGMKLALDLVEELDHKIFTIPLLITNPINDSSVTALHLR